MFKVIPKIYLYRLVLSRQKPNIFVVADVWKARCWF